MKTSTVSERTDVSADTLRYYERIGLLPHINRNKSGIRDYQGNNIKRIEFIKCTRRAGLTIETLSEYISLVQQGDQTIETRKEILTKQREKLIAKMNALQETLDLLDFKMNVYENAVLKRENEIIHLED